jgi:hypothetical protein
MADTRYWGAENATPDRIRRYLVSSYEGVDEACAARLVNTHRELVETGVALASHAAYVGDQIAEREELDWIEGEEE